MHAPQARQRHAEGTCAAAAPHLTQPAARCPHRVDGQLKHTCLLPAGKTWRGGTELQACPHPKPYSACSSKLTYRAVQPFQAAKQAGRVRMQACAGHTAPAACHACPAHSLSAPQAPAPQAPAPGAPAAPPTVPRAGRRMWPLQRITPSSELSLAARPLRTVQPMLSRSTRESNSGLTSAGRRSPRAWPCKERGDTGSSCSLAAKKNETDGTGLNSQASPHSSPHSARGTAFRAPLQFKEQGKVPGG